MPPLPIQDRGYILLHGLTPQQFKRLYPGKKYLLDLGTADFTSSLGWFTEQYGSWGVKFDEIWVSRLPCLLLRSAAVICGRTPPA
jgi:hypothetical protein